MTTRRSRIESLIRIILACLMLAITVICFVNVLARDLFSKPFAWADEVMVFLMIWGVFLGAVVVTLRREHLNMDMIYIACPRGLRRLLLIASGIALALVLGTVSWASWLFLQRIWTLGNKSIAAGIPMVIPHSALTFGFAAMTLAAILLAWRYLRHPEEVPEEEVPLEARIAEGQEAGASRSGGPDRERRG